DGAVRADPSVPAWTDTDLLRLGSDFLRTITIEEPGQAPVNISKQGSGVDASYSIEPMPAGRELGSPSQFARLFGSVAMLTFTDVRSARDDVPAPEHVLRYTTTTGSEFRIDAWSQRDEHGENSTWITIRYEGSQEVRNRLEGWAYQLTPYTAQAFTMGVDDLTYEAVEPDQPVEGPPSGGPGG
ncbi:MAG: hypothetical protein KDB18_12745, partial [Salinibacterium sp.]|nr:hypothetical protein [Salinibacterium sp.]